MVVALGLGRFYGSGLPRPRVFPGDRVDPPLPVTDPLLGWAREAHWSMGGLGSKRLRLQGRIEGNLVKLRRTERRDARRKKAARSAGVKPASLDPLGSDDDGCGGDEEEVEALEREVVDDSEDSDEEVVVPPVVTIAAAGKRKRVRKLSDEFDRVDQGAMKKKQKTAVAVALKRKVEETSPMRKANAASIQVASVRRTSPRSKN